MTTKTTYVSYDGKEFDSEEPCRAWEEVKELAHYADRHGESTGLDPEVFRVFLADILTTFRLILR